MTAQLETDDSGQILHWANPQDITWSIGGVGFPGSHLMPATYAPIIQHALDAWQSVANIHFIHVADAPNVDIRFGFGNLLPQFIGLTTWFESNGSFVPGTILQIEDPHHTALSGPVSDTTKWKGFLPTIVQNLEHEIGHALGLDHDTTDPHALMATVLGPANPAPDASDIAGIQAIYGAPGAPPPSLPPVSVGTGLPHGVRAAEAFPLFTHLG